MKTIMITGANGHLGNAVTKLFLEKGYRVIAVVSPSGRQPLEHEHLETVAADLADEDAAAKIVNDAASKYHTLDAVLLLAGGFAPGDIASTAGSDLQQQVSLNFNTAYFIARPAYAHMKKNGQGRIVFVGARPALSPSFGKNTVAYSLSKSLLFRLAEYINEESKGTDIVATVIAPSTIDTPVNRSSMPHANPGKWVKPEAIAEILEFVVSQKGSALRETVLKIYNNA